MHTETLLQQQVRGIPQPANLQVRDDRCEPGAQTGAQSGTHQHPGPVILAVIEGELVEATAQGARIALRAGQAVWRPALAPHNVQNIGSNPARVLAIHFDPP